MKLLIEVFANGSDAPLMVRRQGVFFLELPQVGVQISVAIIKQDGIVIKTGLIRVA